MTKEEFNKLTDQEKKEAFPMEWVGQGWGYKNNKSWIDINNDEIAYIPEFGYENDLPESIFSKQDIIDLCVSGKLAKELFEMLDWQFPATLLQEWQDIE